MDITLKISTILRATIYAQTGIYVQKCVKLCVYSCVYLLKCVKFFSF